MSALCRFFEISRYADPRKEDTLNTNHYQLRLEGLTEAQGQIKAQALQDDLLFPEIATRTTDSDPMALWGAWPGAEPIEELMAMLD